MGKEVNKKLVDLFKNTSWLCVGCDKNVNKVVMINGSIPTCLTCMGVLRDDNKEWW